MASHGIFCLFFTSVVGGGLLFEEAYDPSGRDCTLAGKAH